jgi:hypothetical protein
VAQAAGLSAPAPIAPRHQPSIDDAVARLRRARALNDQAHELQIAAAKVAAASLKLASHDGIRNKSWWQHVTHAVAQWATAQWAEALREVSKLATAISAVAGVAALVLAVAGVMFPPLEAAAGALEGISLASAVVAGMSDTILAATGKGSWGHVGIDALAVVPAGVGRFVTKVAPAIRESRLIQPTTVAHASTGGAGERVSSVLPSQDPPPHITGGGTRTRVINYRPKGAHPSWGLRGRHLEKHFFGSGRLSLSTIDPTGNAETWLGHIQELATRAPTATLNGGVEDIVGTFQKADGSGTFGMGIRISPTDAGSFDLVTVLTRQR